MKNTKSRLPNGSGTLVKVGRIWHVRWSFRGKVHESTTHQTDKREARRVADEILRPFNGLRVQDTLEHTRCLVIESNKDDIRDVKLSTVWEKFAGSKYRRPLAPASEAGYKSALERVTTFFNSRKWVSVAQIGKGQVEAYLEYKKDSPAGAKVEVAIMRNIWGVLSNDFEVFKRNPWVSAGKLINVPKSRKEAFTEEELSKIEEYLKSNDLSMYRLESIARYTGLRINDCCHLTWGDVDFDTGLVVVTPHKTKHSTGVKVYLPLLEPLKVVLQDIPRGDSEFVLPDMAKEYDERRPDVSARFTKSVRKAGVETKAENANGKSVSVKTFHSLRHTFVSECVKRGVPLDVVRTLVGHSTTAMSAHYLHVNADVVREAFNKVAG